jgi:hypothetical protein
MDKINKNDLGYLGIDFQYRLIQQLLLDSKFGESIVDIIKPNYFDDVFLRTVCGKIIDNYEEYEVIPSFDDLQSILFESIIEKVDKLICLEQFQKIRDSDQNNYLRVQDTAMKFCKQQEAKKAVRSVQKIIDNGDLDKYYQIEEIFKKALEVGNEKDGGIDVFHDINNVMADDFREPIPTGINGLDGYMDGGLAKGELGVVLAPFGVGKTTFMTILANNAKGFGKNVLQIFFEDNPKVIQRKHLTCWMNGKYTLNELNDNREEVLSVANVEQQKPGVIKLKKMPSDGTTIPQIKQYIKKLIAKGFRPDVLLLDYIDCVQPTKQFKDEWSGEGNVMRQFETMLSELDIAGWTAVQGNRSSINAPTVDSSMIGGSIKKGQIGHFILSIAKSLDQKEGGTANIAILKSRFGKDGIVFSDITFDNGRVLVDISEDGERGNSFLEAREIKQQTDQNRVTEVFNAVDNT